VASLLVACPLLGQRQAEVEQDMVVVRDVAHEDADLAVVNLAPVAAPLPLYSHRMRPALGEAAGIEGDDAIGLPQLIGRLSDQHCDQRAVVPRGRTDEVLQDLSLDIDQGGDRLGILTVHVGQQALEVEVHGVLAGLSLERLLVG
jgi:hypothetical protein